MTYGAHEDIAVRYVTEVIDRGIAQLLEKDRAVRKSTTETTSVMRRQAEQAASDSHIITSAADREARAYMRTGSSSLQAAARQREASTMNVSAMERTARGAEEMERRAARSFRQTVSHARQTHGPLRDLARAGAALGGTYVGYQAAKGAIEDTLSLAKTTRRLSDATGLAYQNSSALLSSTRARGIADNKLETSLGILATRTHLVAQGTDKQRQSIIGLNSVANTFTGRQRELAATALHAARGSDAQVRALTSLKRSLSDEAAAHMIARAGRRAATLSQAQQYTMTRAQIAAWHDQQAALAAGNRQSEAVSTQTRKRQATAIADALTAASSTNKQSDAFRELGITQDEIKRGAHDMHFLLGRVAEGFNQLGAGADKVALSRQLFGRGSSQLMPIIEGYQEQIKLAKDYGATLDGHTIKSLEQMEEAQRKVNLSSTALKLSFTQAVQPALLSLAHTTSDVTRAWSDPKLTTFDQRMQATAKGLEKLHIGEHLGKAIELGLPIIARSAARTAPVILGAIAKGFAHAGLVGDAVILAWGAKKLGLWSALGKTAGKAFFAKFLEGQVGSRLLGGSGLAGKALGKLDPVPVYVVNEGFGGVPGGGGVPEPIPAGAGKRGLFSRAVGFAKYAGPAAIAADVLVNPDTAGLSPAREQANIAAAKARSGGANVMRDNGFLIKTWQQDLEKVDALLAKMRAEGADSHFVDQVKSRRDALKGEIADMRKYAADTDSILSGRVGQTLKQTEGNFEAMRISTRGHLKDITAATHDNMTTIASELGTKSAAGKTALAANFMDAAGEIKRAMDDGRISVRTGLREIDDLLSKRLQVYGFSKADAHKFNQTTSIEATRGHALGGYVGTPGEQGRDRVPIVVGRGESVNTIHQQREINQGLAIAKAATAGRYRWGHLNDLYSNVTTPHWANRFAAGGYVFPLPDFGSEQRVDRGQDMEARRPYANTVALGDGTVTSATIGWPGMRLRLDGGPFAGHEVFYGHNNRVWAKVGQHLRAGQRIGQVGNLSGGGDSRHTEIGFMEGYSAQSGHWIGPGSAGGMLMHRLLHQIAPRWIGVDPLGGYAAGWNRQRISKPIGHLLASLGAAGPHAWKTLPYLHTAMPGMLGGVIQGALNLAHAAANARGHRLVTDGGGSGAGGGNYTGPLDRTFPSHHSYTGARLSPKQVRMLAARAGLPSWFWKIAHGESQYYPGIIGDDPNGYSHGNGLYQITPEVQSPAARRHLQAMGSYFNPWTNTLMAKWMYDQAPVKTPGVKGFPWYGTKYLERGGYAWGGWHGNGTDTTVSRPTLFGAGERGPERVTIQPMERGGWPGSFDAATSTLLRAPSGDLQRSGSIHRQALAGLAELLDKTGPAAINAAALRIRDVLARLRAHNAGDLRVPLLARAVGDIDKAMYSRAEKWIAGFAKAGTGAGAKHTTSTRLGSLPTVLANVTYGQLGHLATSIHHEAAGLTINDRRYKHVEQAATAAQKNLDAARKQTKAQRDALAKDRKSGQSQATLDADQARIDADKRHETALAATEKTAKKHVDHVKHRQQVTTARLNALHSAGAAVHTAQGAAIDRGASDAQAVAGLADKIETATDRRLRRQGIDPGSSTGLAAQVADSGKEIGKLETSRTLLQTQLARAEKLGDRGRAGQIRQQLGQVTDSLDERRTQQIERTRDLARHRTQDKVDTVDFESSRADIGLQRLQISQQLLGTAGTAGGGQQMAEYIRKTIEPLDDKRTAALQDKLKELQAEPTPDATLIRQTLLDIDTSKAKRDQDELDATNAVKDSVDNLQQFGGSTAFGYHGQDETDMGVGV